MKNKIIVNVILTVSLIVTQVVRADYNRAQEFFINKEFGKAVAEIENLLISEPDNLNYLGLKADINISQNNFKKAEETYRKSLKIKKDYETTLKLARLLSWMGKYRQSVNYYQKAIDFKEKDIEPYIEKARVYGWWGKKKMALDAYSQAYNIFNKEWIKYEKLAKKNLWSGKPKSALIYFNRSLRDNENNPEILFDAAQLYSAVGEYKKADEYYEKLLKLNSYNTSVKKAKDKNSLKSSGLSVKGSVNYWNAESSERNTDVKMYSYKIGIKKKLDKFYLGGHVIKDLYGFDREDDINQTGGGLSFGYDVPLLLGFGMGTTLKKITSPEIKRDSYYGYFWVKPVDRVDMNITVVKNNNINNRDNILDKLDEKDAKIKIGWTLDPRLELSTDFKYGDLNDGNIRKVTGAGFTCHFLEFPHKLYFSSRFENKRYNNQRNAYFSPDNYTTYSAIAGFKKNMGKEGNFFGAKKIYYDIKYEITYDSNRELSHRPGLSFYYDITRNTNFEASYSITESYYYEDTSASLIFNTLF
ncbi:MAG: tetratricopeptide repeat protein [Elusimicrobiota bacterium]